MSDNLPASYMNDGSAETPSDFIRTYYDDETGRTILALGPEAADALDDMLDLLYAGDIRKGRQGQFENPARVADILEKLQGEVRNRWRSR